MDKVVNFILATRQELNAIKDQAKRLNEYQISL